MVFFRCKICIRPRNCSDILPSRQKNYVLLCILPVLSQPVQCIHLLALIGIEALNIVIIFVPTARNVNK